MTMDEAIPDELRPRVEDLLEVFNAVVLKISADFGQTYGLTVETVAILLHHSADAMLAQHKDIEAVWHMMKSDSGGKP